MNRTAREFDRASDRMTKDFRAMVADSEDLLKAAANASSEGFTAARAKFEEKLSGAKAMLADAAQPVLERAAEAAGTANRYVHVNPWTAVGVAVAAGALIGFLAAKR
jgi:ElaB/YqjD/DUF883 family membrane-anchored ribosome-binding protein